MTAWGHLRCWATGPTAPALVLGEVRRAATTARAVYTVLTTVEQAPVWQQLGRVVCCRWTRHVQPRGRALLLPPRPLQARHRTSRVVVEEPVEEPVVGPVVAPVEEAVDADAEAGVERITSTSSMERDPGFSHRHTHTRNYVNPSSGSSSSSSSGSSSSSSSRTV